MKRFLKISVVVLICLIALLAVGITLTIGWRPFICPRSRPLTNRVFERTPERWARGKYLAENVAACVDCHSPHDWTKHDSPVPPGMEGAGEDISILKGLPGTVVAPNLTPDPETGTGTWTDDALARAIREGIGHDGRTLFPLMPYEGYRYMPDEDLASVIVFLRSLPPVRNPLPKTNIIFPVKYLIRSVPQPITDPVPLPDVSDPVKRGAFLVTMAGCKDCHTPMDHGEPIPGMDLSGGQLFEGPWGSVATPNLTPDPSGIPYYDEALFLQAIRTGYVRARSLNQIMPWRYYAGMTDEDLKAIFAYLKTVKPVKHFVDNSEPPTLCVICKTTHGGGERNQKN
ncbi:MAG TPA: c-type cytochrome [Candidatus Acidoferrales bacterium]|nr:c-type cytochrome [Candidatus Acidoferrales bacterium]